MRALSPVLVLLCFLPVLRCHAADLFSAARAGDLAAVQAFLDAGVSATAPNALEWTPLAVAVNRGQLAVVRLLLEKGADANDSTPIGMSMLALAIEQDNLELVRVLLEHGAKADARAEDDAQEMSPLERAASGQQAEIARLLVERGAQWSLEAAAALPAPAELERLFKAGATIRPSETIGGDIVTSVIHYGTDDVEALELLLAHGGNVNVEGGHALRLAAGYGHPNQVRVLLARGARIDLKDSMGHLAIHDAACSGNPEVLKLLLEAGAKWSLAIAAMAGDVTRIRQLATKQGLTARGLEGLTPLHWAARCGRTNAVAALLALGTDPNVKGERGVRPLHCAAESGSVPTMRVLLDKGATVTGRDDNDGTPLHLAAAEGPTEAVALLLARGASINATARAGADTPLHRAAERGQAQVVKLLLDHKATVDPRNFAGCTPLFAAVYGNHVAVARLLLDHGARVNLRNYEEVTVLDIAEANIWMEMGELVELLKAHGAK